MATFGINNFLNNNHVSNAVNGINTIIDSGARSPLHGLHTILGSTHDAVNFVKNFQKMDGANKIAMIAKLILGNQK